MSGERSARDAGAARAYHVVAGAAIGLTFAVVAASALLRHVHAGALSAGMADGTVSAARIAHRLSATAVVAAVAGLLLVAWTQRPVWRAEALAATAALVLVAALAAVGIVAGASQAPAVVATNVVGGHALLALGAVAWTLSSTLAPVGRTARALAVAALVGVLAVGGAGAVTDAAHALPAWLHRSASVAVAVLAALVAYALRRSRPRVAAWLAIALGLTAALGIVAIAWTNATTLVAHGLAAAATATLLAVAAVDAKR